MNPLKSSDREVEERCLCLSTGRILALAVFFGLATGLMEVLARSIQVWGLGNRIWMTWDVVWLAPLADVVLMGAAALICFLVERMRPGTVTPVRLLTLYLFLAVAGPIIAYPRIYRVASLLLALGIAVRLAVWLARHFGSVYRLAATGTRWIIAIIALLTVVERGAALWKERRALAALPPSVPGAPNVLLIILDTVRAANLGVYGYGRPTSPVLDSIAASGVVFEHAWATSPWTLPSHASMFTGHPAHELNTDLLTPLDRTYPVLAERFAAAGYRTAGFVANLLYTTRETGLQRGFAHFEDYPISVGMVINSSWLVRTIALWTRHRLGDREKLVRKHADQVEADFLAWESRRPNRPFFAFLNLFDAHAPYLPPDSLAGRFGPIRIRPALSSPGSREHWSPDEIDAERAAYDAKLATMDRTLGTLMAELRRRGVAKNTLVIIAADHGEQFGEHHLMGHANSLYRVLLEVPLVMIFPGRIPAAARVATPVSLADIPATIEDLVWRRRADGFPGHSLRSLWEHERTDRSVELSPVLSEVRKGPREREWLPVSKGGMQSLVERGYHYIRRADGMQELYDLKNDPLELQDLSKTAPGTMLTEFHTRLSTLAGDHARPTRHGHWRR